MLVSPSKGTIRIVDLPEGTMLEPGTAVGTLVTSRDEQPVVAPHGGTVVEWLVVDGDPVSPGQPIIRLHPQSNEAVH
jgi:[acyl-carrier-protein] S-malonyltransferase